MKLADMTQTKGLIRNSSAPNRAMPGGQRLSRSVKYSAPIPASASTSVESRKAV